MKFFKKTEKVTTEDEKHNWYKDRHQMVIIQRNFLSLLIILMLVGLIVSILAAVKVVKSKNIEPFVIEIEEKTGITNVIRPFLQESLQQDEVMRRFYIFNYLNYREGYNYTTYKHDYYTKIRLWSNANVYRNFVQSINESNPNSPLRLGASFTREIAIKNINYLSSSKAGFAIQVRFSQIDRGITSKNMNAKVQREKILSMSFNYYDIRLTDKERAINPLGFQVTSYQVQNENL